MKIQTIQKSQTSLPNPSASALPILSPEQSADYQKYIDLKKQITQELIQMQADYADGSFNSDSWQKVIDNLNKQEAALPSSPDPRDHNDKPFESSNGISVYIGGLLLKMKEEFSSMKDGSYNPNYPSQNGTVNYPFEVSRTDFDSEMKQLQANIVKAESIIKSNPSSIQSQKLQMDIVNWKYLLWEMQGNEIEFDCDYVDDGTGIAGLSGALFNGAIKDNEQARQDFNLPSISRITYAKNLI